jgi:hypothetical protein
MGPCHICATQFQTVIYFVSYEIKSRLTFWLTYFQCYLAWHYVLVRARAGLKPIIPTAPNLAPHWSYLLSAVQIHATTHCRFYKEQQWVPHLLRPILLRVNVKTYYSFISIESGISMVKDLIFLFRTDMKYRNLSY